MINKNKDGLGEVCLGRFLDVSHGVGLLMPYWIFPDSVIPLSISTFQRVTSAELETDVMEQQCGTFDKSMQESFRDDVIMEQGKLPTFEQYPEFLEDETLVEELQRVFRNEDIAEADDEFDPY